MSKMFEPIKIGNLELKNRFIMAPMENGMAGLGTGDCTDRIIAFFQERAKHDVSMIMPGSIGVSPEGRGLPTQLSLYEERHVAEHKRLVDGIHAAGAKAGAQIYHAGRQASEAITGCTPLAPSAMPCSLLGNHPEEITLEQMEEIKQKFIKATRWSIEAGYDLVEVHFAHGYLLHSFMSTHSNFRTDEYGGSFENRIRYPMEVLEACIKEANGEVPIQIRVSVDEYVADGMHYDEVEQVCILAEKAGVSSISLSAGCYDAVDYAIQPMYVPQGFILPYAKQLVKKVNVPVIVAARLNNAKMIENIFDEGMADIVAIGRGLIADPAIIEKIQNKDYDNIRYCIACNQGCIDRVLGGMPAHCMVNPVAGEEATRQLKPKTSDKTISVIGAGPAGMQAALTLSQRGYDVTLYGNMDGKMSAVATAPEKDTFNLFKNYLKNQIAKANIQVIDKMITPEDTLDTDVVIIATGSNPIIPNIEGVNNDNVVIAEDVLNGKEVAGNVVVIGAGLVGTETCKYLGNKGIQCTLVEMKDSIADGIGATFVGHMFDKLAEYNVKVMTSATVNKITDEGVIVNDALIPCDSVVLACGYKANNALQDTFSKDHEVYVIGDAKQARRILDATEEAYLIANEI
ncbi:MAG: FAD-dependent oxidoreductase [Holdemanella sp.]|nr:FAD-dependent oxidoreductase [Holdemanella sp.]